MVMKVAVTMPVPTMQGDCTTRRIARHGSRSSCPMKKEAGNMCARFHVRHCLNVGMTLAQLFV